MICNKKILLKEHPLGLVFEDEHFLCEKCNEKLSKDELSKLNKTIMQSPQNGMPIALWLIHEQNKHKTMMTGKNELP
jgi:transcription initiation factor IIE alpha subunit